MVVPKINETKRIHPPYLRLKAWLIENDVLLREIAAVLGITEKEVGRKNNGYSDYSVADLNKLMDHFDLGLEMFLNCPEKV